MQLAKILILKVYIGIHVYTCVYLHPWVILCIFDFLRFLCLGFYFYIHLLSSCPTRLSPVGWLAGDISFSGSHRPETGILGKTSMQEDL